jgi:hypothetical protein
MQYNLTTNPKDPVNKLIIIYILAVLAAILMWGCDPVKQVLRDRDKMDKVAEILIRDGYCANDTVNIVKSDTLISIDTITNTVTNTLQRNDTVYLWETKYHNILKTVKIHDTVKQVVVDKARTDLLIKDKVKLMEDLDKVKEQSRARLNWIIVLLLIMGGYVYFKIRK